MAQWETVIGLEIHTQLSTQSKIFSGASTAYGAEPNTQACAVDLGLPGVLPVLNEDAVHKAVISRLILSSPAKIIFTQTYPKAIKSAKWIYPSLALDI
jgi:aspartyl-tRNA(Asn)/glutamyl-tRNA(Gln) amidotransferase subunit B